MDAESGVENANVAHQLSAQAVPNSDYGVTRSFAFAVSKTQEDVITEKPEASNTFLIS